MDFKSLFKTGMFIKVPGHSMDFIEVYTEVPGQSKDFIEVPVQNKYLYRGP